MSKSSISALGLAFALALSGVAVTTETAEAKCGGTGKNNRDTKNCGFNGARHAVPLDTLTPLEQQLAVKSVSGSKCEFRQFRADGGYVANPRVFVSDGAAVGCPGVQPVNCPKCTGWIHSGRGRISGPAASLRQTGRGKGFSVEPGTGMMVPKSFQGTLGWCDFGVSPTWASYTFGS